MTTPEYHHYQGTAAEKLWVLGLSGVKRYIPKDGQDFPEMIHRPDDFVHVRRVRYLGDILVNVLRQDPFSPYKPDLRKVQDMGYHHDDSEIATKDTIATEKSRMNKEKREEFEQDDDTFDTFIEKYPFYNELKDILEFNKIPSPEMAVALPTISIDDLKKPTNVTEFMSPEKTKEWPTCYRTWAELGSIIFDKSPEKFLFPGWYMQLWTKWNTFKSGKTTSSGLIIP